MKYDRFFLGEDDGGANVSGGGTGTGEGGAQATETAAPTTEGENTGTPTGTPPDVKAEGEGAAPVADDDDEKVEGDDRPEETQLQGETADTAEKTPVAQTVNEGAAPAEKAEEKAKEQLVGAQ